MALLRRFVFGLAGGLVACFCGIGVLGLALAMLIASSVFSFMENE